MANIIKLGSLFLDGRPVKTGRQYVPSQTIEVGEMTPSKEIGWVAVNGLLIADQCLLTNVSWDDLDVQGLVFGKEVTVQGLRFKIRLLKVGSKEDVPNEWDDALDAIGEDDALWHWRGKYFWGQESASESSSCRVRRGYSSARNFNWHSSGTRAGASVSAPPWSLCPLPPLPSGMARKPWLLAGLAQLLADS